MADQSPEGDVPDAPLVGDDPLEIRSELVAFFAQQELRSDCFLSAEFIRFEQQDPTVDHDFAKHVLRLTESSQELDETSADTIRELVRLIVRDVHPSELHGRCAQISEVVLAMLTKLGIWSFGVMGSTATTSSLGSKVFNFNPDPGPTQAYGHHWVVVPPFAIVDLTISHQYNLDDKWQEILPKYVLMKDSEAPCSNNLVPPNAELASAYDMHQLNRLWTWLPRRTIRCGEVEVLYQPHDIQLPSALLDGEVGDIPVGGREARSWFKDVFLVEGGAAKP